MIVDVLLAPPTLPFRSNKAAPHFDNGMKVVQAALAKHPATPVLFISSHTSLTLLSKGIDGRRWPVLRKPFSPTVLRTEIGIRLEAARDKTATRRDPRDTPRYSIGCRVDYTGDHEGTGVTQDLSLGGCPLKTDIQVEVGAHLTLQLALPERPIPIKIHVSVVRWSTPSQCGLDFVLIEELEQRLLSEYFERLAEGNRNA